MEDQETVLVFGDPAIDQVLATREPDAQDQKYDWQRHPQYQFWEMQGGVHLTETGLTQLGFRVRKVAAPWGNFVLKTLVRIGRVIPDGKGGHEFERPGAAHRPGAPNLYRVIKHEGYFPAATSALEVTTNPSVVEKRIFVNDAGGATRRLEGIGGCFSSAKLVLHKMHLPLRFDTRLVDEIKRAADALKTLVVTASDLRAEGVRLRASLSWNMFLEDLSAAVQDKTGPLSEALGIYDTVVVLAGEDGAVAISRYDQQTKLDAALDSSAAEGEHDTRHLGDLIGKANAFACGLFHSLAKSSDGASPKPAARDLAHALATARDYSRRCIEIAAPETGGDLVLPCLRESSAEIEADKRRFWLAHRLEISSTGFDPHEAIDRVETAKRIVRDGPAALSALLYLRIGRYLTLDRVEIEAFRAIRTQVSAYLQGPPQAKPLSLAVFGPPGSGKSFGIKELAADHNLEVFENNLSEASAEALPGYFQELRDITLSGRTPLCFFDEFDARNCEMVGRFLAPMQDGRFRDGPRTHPLGRAILVFAGGTAASAAEFAGYSNLDSRKYKRTTTESGAQELAEARARDEDRKQKKIPDFVSRLAGVIDIRGINEVAPGKDPDFVLRRAVLLRSMLEQHRREIFDVGTETLRIDDGVLTAFLTCSSYRFGARSMEKIVMGSAVHPNRVRFGAADLPPAQNLTVHLVDPDEFLKIAAVLAQ